MVIFWVFRVGNLIEQREDVSGSHPAQPAETGRKAHHPQRQRHRDVDPCLQYKEGLQTRTRDQLKYSNKESAVVDIVVANVNAGDSMNV